MDGKFINIEKLKPYPNNPRLSKKAIDPVAKSISEFGFRVPILIDDKYVIIAGHTRLAACKKLGMKEVPCIMISDLTTEKINALRIADNSVGSISEFDEIKLLSELSNITLDMSGLGIPDVTRSEKDCKLSDLSMVPVLSTFFFIKCDICDAHQVITELEKMKDKLGVIYAQSSN